jgi:DNA-binding transcriptional LysR family regulator
MHLATYRCVDATIELDLLVPFVAVAEAASFSAAADRLGVSKGTVSRKIARLERRVGAELLHRTTRRVALSTAGVALYERVAPHLSGLQRAIGSMPEREEQPSGELRVTAPTDFGVVLLPAVAARFALRYPAVRIDVHLGQRQVDLVGEGFDLAIRGAGGQLRDSSLAMRRLMPVEFLAYASPVYVARRGHPREIGDEDHEWVGFRPALRQLGFPSGARPRIAGDDFFFVREAIRAGAGVGVLPTFVAEPLAKNGELVRVLPSFRVRTAGFVLLYPSSGTVARKVTAFRDLLVETFKTGRLAW